MRFIFPEAKRPWKVALSLATILMIGVGWFLITRNERVQPLFLPRPDDVIREINRQKVRNLADYERFTREAKDGDRLTVLLQRGPMSLYVAFTVGRG